LTKTRVLIVDGSAAARQSLARALGGAEQLEVAGAAAHADEALSLITHHRPDIITLDAHLGEGDGIELAARIMTRRPLPILVVTGLDPRSPDLAFRAIQAGALDVLPKLPAASHPDYPHERQRMIRALLALSRVPLVTRHKRVAAPAEAAPRAAPRASLRPVSLVAIGASTGGPPVLRDILGALPSTAFVPIAIVQHVTAGFAHMLADWLASATGHAVRVCDQPMHLAPGTIYLASTNVHMRLTSPSTIAPSDAPPRNFQRPSIDVLLESAAAWLGASAVGVLLTGMGRDGAAGLLHLRNAGAFTVVQSAASCVVDSMPMSAVELGAACATQTPAELALSLKVIAAR
jgi:two-component system, chemotaxis family, protein-glutamate methylesterase/glutaminase